MTNYDMDELRRQGKVPDLEKRKEFAKDINENEKKSVHDTRILGKDEEPWTAIDVEIPDEAVSYTHLTLPTSDLV